MKSQKHQFSQGFVASVIVSGLLVNYLITRALQNRSNDSLQEGFLRFLLLSFSFSLFACVCLYTRLTINHYPVPTNRNLDTLRLGHFTEDEENNLALPGTSMVMEQASVTGRFAPEGRRIAESHQTDSSKVVELDGHFGSNTSFDETNYHQIDERLQRYEKE